MSGTSHDYDSREQPPPAYDDREQQPPALPDEKKSATATTEAVDNRSEIDGASLLAGSTFSGFAPSSIEGRHLLGSGRRTSRQYGVQKTPGRKAYEGVCRTVDWVVPLDINENATDMQSSSLGKLARVMGGKRASLSEHDQRATGRSAETSSIRTARDAGKASGSNIS